MSATIPKRTSWRVVVFLVLAVLAIVALYYSLKAPGASTEILSQARFYDLIKDGRVMGLVEELDASTGARRLSGWYDNFDGNGAKTGTVAFSLPIDLQFDPRLLQELRDAGYTRPIDTVYDSDVVWPLIINLLPIVVFVTLMYFLFRKTLKLRAAANPAAPPAQ